MRPGGGGRRSADPGGAGVEAAEVFISEFVTPGLSASLSDLASVSKISIHFLIGFIELFLCLHSLKILFFWPAFQRPARCGCGGVIKERKEDFCVTEVSLAGHLVRSALQRAAIRSILNCQIFVPIA